ncbi:cob(I)yrinic acid a,c-diamide adenosyltransferase [Azotosporobacter soli]|uniref:cob(I)yrinic acid a,c-diamide adenosyltransferase n=1 Tax=Azotosporobacter soli TaxID=3055040 RepID=UPI0031FF3F3D
MKVYTKTGDKGFTSLYTGERIEKNSQRVEAYGTIDELTSSLGLARSLAQQEEVRDAILALQKQLMSLMAELASSDSVEKYIQDIHVTTLETTIDVVEAQLPPLREFIIPGDNPAAAALNIARTVARRAEREILRLSSTEPVGEPLLKMVNRISDYCFVLGRLTAIPNT